VVGKQSVFFFSFFAPLKRFFSPPLLRLGSRPLTAGSCNLPIHALHFMGRSIQEVDGKGFIQLDHLLKKKEKKKKNSIHH